MDSREQCRGDCEQGREDGGVLRVRALELPGFECAHVQRMSLLRAARVDGAARTDSTTAQGEGGDRGGRAQGGGGQGRAVLVVTRLGGVAASVGAGGRTRAARGATTGGAGKKMPPRH